LTFQEGIKSNLNYSIDDVYGGDIPLTVVNASDFHIIITEMVVAVPLPPLSDGTHCLSITVDAELNDYHGANPPGAPFKATTPEGTNYAAVWVHTVYFTIDTKDATPTTPALTMSTPKPTASENAAPTPTMPTPTAEPKQTAPITIILIVAVVIAYIFVIAFLVVEKR